MSTTECREKVKMSIVDAMEENMRQKLKYIPSSLSSMAVETIGSVSIVDSALPSDTFNTAYGGEISEEVAKEVYNFYKKRNAPMAWWVGPSSTNGREKQALEEAGFLHSEHDVGMACDLTALKSDYCSPEELEIVECKREEEFRDFGEVLASIFNPIDSQVVVFYKMMGALPEERRRQMPLYVGYVDGRAVATSCLFLTEVAGIFDIATHPEYRKKGYGSALFHAVLQRAKREGFRRALLQASPDGLNIYKRFGFEKVCDFNVYAMKQ